MAECDRKIEPNPPAPKVVRLGNRPVVLRFAADNVGDERYWANVAPVGQNGYTGTDNGTGTLGVPRTFRASIEVGF